MRRHGTPRREGRLEIVGAAGKGSRYRGLLQKPIDIPVALLTPRVSQSCQKTYDWRDNFALPRPREAGDGATAECTSEDLALGRPVALKLVPRELSADHGMTARFQHEARTASSLEPSEHLHYLRDWGTRAVTSL